MSWAQMIAMAGCVWGMLNLAAVGEDRVGAITYFEGFETENPVREWTSKGQYRVNFAGLADERSHSGKRSFKLDLTIVRDGDYNYWCGPVLDLPAVEGLAMSGYIYIAEASPGISVGLGTSFYMPAVAHATGSAGRGISHIISEFSHKHAGEWIHQQADIPLVGRGLSRQLLGEEAPGIYLEKWGLQIFCRAVEPGSRIVIYIDDISIQGNVPPDWHRRTELQLTDWRVAYNARQQADLSVYRDALARIGREAQALIDQLPTQAQVEEHVRGPWQAYALTMLAEARKTLEQAIRDTAGDGQPPTDINEAIHDLWDTCIRPVQGVSHNLRRLARSHDPYLVFVLRDPISNYHVLPTRPLIGGAIDDTIRLFASPGEYEPASFVLLTSTDTTATFEVGALRSADGNQIDAEALDLRVVKAWYQAGQSLSQTTGNILVAELLLHDDELVQVDLVKQRNTVRDIDAPRDAATLQPVRLTAGQPKQFWLTAHLPENTPAAKYTGEIRMSLEGLSPRTLHVELEVLPFKLAGPGKDYGLYYRGQLNDDADKLPVSSDRKTAAQLEADFRNMLAHGVTLPDVYERASLEEGRLNAETLTRYLDIKEKAGLPLSPLLFLGVGATAVHDDAELAQRVMLYRQVMAYAASRGIEEVYFYGQDEAMGEALKSQRRVWEAVHQANGKVWVACSAGFFDVVGDLLDLPVVARHAPQDLKRVHELGRKAWVYSVPFGGGTLEKPYSQRYRWGFWLDRSGFDGVHNYCYQHAEGPGGMMGRPWDDFDSTIYRSINYTYPTVEGPVDTLQWEAVREGIDDMRYLATLRGLIRQAESSQMPLAVEAANECKRWLEQADINRDLQTLRRGIADRAVRLQKLLNDEG